MMKLKMMEMMIIIMRKLVIKTITTLTAIIISIKIYNSYNKYD